MRSIGSIRTAAALLAIVILVAASARAEDKAAPARSGLHDFDFEFGDWGVHHRVKRATGDWWEFDGTASARPIMDGAMNVEDNRFDKPNGVTRGVAFRAYDAKTEKWAIWWVDGRNPHGPVDPPSVGHFENGVGTFYSDVVIDGKTIRSRIIWSHITPTSAHWEQASSVDAGKTWETNWVMEFKRASS